MVIMLFFLFAACAHMSSTWKVVPLSEVDLPGAAVTVVMSDSGCRGLADALTVEINRRVALRVDPASGTRLALSHCNLDVGAEVDLTQMYAGLGAGLTGGEEHRNEIIRAKASAVLTVEIDSRPVATLGAKGQRVRHLLSADNRRTQARVSVVDGVMRDMARQLAQQIAPEPEVVRRRTYRNPDQGSAHALHNEAVAAERRGELGRALTLAKQAAGALPTPAAQAYVKELDTRLRSRRYVER
jgi:hypothetical protein